jgi:hypothetical protein
MRRCGLLLGSRCGHAAKPALTHATANATTSIGRHVSGIADPFNGNIDAFRIAHVQRSDGWIETTWNNMSDPGAFAAAGAEAREGGEPPPLASAGVVVCLMG